MKFSFAIGFAALPDLVVCRVVVSEPTGAPFNLSYVESFINSLSAC